MSRVMLEVRELSTKYITRFREDIYAVNKVSLKIEEGKSKDEGKDEKVG